ncbi:MAG TPA: hypothetical protein VHA77_15630 [Xanthobacteraceae bacterium]|jgi:hypothetical protein|nr:hypothetical protein [Xanthobacteraceae bacterium]
MYVFLLAIGAVAAVVGMFLITFGVPIHEFNFGNTLIVAGTTTLMGGLLLIGIALMVRQLQRIAETLAARPAGRPVRAVSPDAAMLRESGEPAPARGPAQGPAPARIPFPPRPPEPVRERSGEPRLAPLPPDEHEAEEASPDRVRPNIVPIPRSAEPPLSEPENIPIFPHIGGRPAARGAAGEGRSEPKFEAPRRPNVVPGGRGEKTAGPRFAAAGERPLPDTPGRGSFFDAVWPAGSKGKRSQEPGGRSRPEPAPLPGRAGANPPDEDPMPSIVRAPGAPAPVPEQRPASILKSGVIDGMAYTLYTDGSIEAQLPQGLMRFDSIEALRVHLEKSA